MPALGRGTARVSLGRRREKLAWCLAWARGAALVGTELAVSSSHTGSVVPESVSRKGRGGEATVSQEVALPWGRLGLPMGD